jgi:hypothetical protein
MQSPIFEPRTPPHTHTTTNAAAACSCCRSAWQFAVLLALRLGSLQLARSLRADNTVCSIELSSVGEFLGSIRHSDMRCSVVQYQSCSLTFADLCARTVWPVLLSFAHFPLPYWQFSLSPSVSSNSVCVPSCRTSVLAAIVLCVLCAVLLALLRLSNPLCTLSSHNSLYVHNV